MLNLCHQWTCNGIYNGSERDCFVCIILFVQVPLCPLHHCPHHLPLDQLLVILAHPPWASFRYVYSTFQPLQHLLYFFVIDVAKYASFFLFVFLKNLKCLLKYLRPFCCGKIHETRNTTILLRNMFFFLSIMP